MADLNNYNCTATLDVPFELVENDSNTPMARGRLSIHNYGEFYVKPWVVVEGRKVHKVLDFKEGDSIVIKNASLKSENREIEHTVKHKVLQPNGRLELQDKVFVRGYTDVFIYIDDRDISDIQSINGDLSEYNLNSLNFTGRICTEPQSRIVGANKNALSFVSASNFAKRELDPAYVYIVIEGREAVRLEGRLSINSKFSGSAMLRTKQKDFIFEYEDTEIDEDATEDGVIRYKQIEKTTEVSVDQLEVLFLDYLSQLNFIDNIKNPDLAEQFGEI